MQCTSDDDCIKATEECNTDTGFCQVKSSGRSCETNNDCQKWEKCNDAKKCAPIRPINWFVVISSALGVFIMIILWFIISKSKASRGLKIISTIPFIILPIVAAIFIIYKEIYAMKEAKNKWYCGNDGRCTQTESKYAKPYDSEAECIKAGCGRDPYRTFVCSTECPEDPNTGYTASKCCVPNYDNFGSDYSKCINNCTTDPMIDLDKIFLRNINFSSYAEKIRGYPTPIYAAVSSDYQPMQLDAGIPTKPSSRKLDTWKISLVKVKEKSSVNYDYEDYNYIRNGDVVKLKTDINKYLWMRYDGDSQNVCNRKMYSIRANRGENESLNMFKLVSANRPMGDILQYGDLIKLQSYDNKKFINYDWCTGGIILTATDDPKDNKAVWSLEK